MSCCNDCGKPPVGWSHAGLTACVRATRAVRPATIISPNGGAGATGTQVAVGEWIVRIPALDMTIVLPDAKFRAAFKLEEDHAG